MLLSSRVKTLPRAAALLSPVPDRCGPSFASFTSREGGRERGLAAGLRCAVLSSCRRGARTLWQEWVVGACFQTDRLRLVRDHSSAHPSASVCLAADPALVTLSSAVTGASFFLALSTVASECCKLKPHYANSGHHDAPFKETG